MITLIIVKLNTIFVTHQKKWNYLLVGKYINPFVCKKLTKIKNILMPVIFILLHQLVHKIAKLKFILIIRYFNKKHKIKLFCCIMSSLYILAIFSCHEILSFGVWMQLFLKYPFVKPTVYIYIWGAYKKYVK